ncbi:hypothetical protein [Deinococcus humi]|uniref:N-acetyltransferase domain-containing protein n=1 Tax=Deinococcus humi TaxID=662880 RepID=A0A7W8JXK1_9DEIO|nr:hypothetical protein [Deinococcus humi]MBB5363504.1 hypothetical protein [Deinococcus humi]GGO30486.1 hypothetical protein GCM10008949_25390 [Deinococcus humi]
MTVPPALTPVLIERLERAVLRKGRDALLRAAALPDNPYAVTVTQRGDLLAYRVGTLPHLPWYNTMTGVSEATLPALDEVLALYAASGIPPSLSVWATHLSPVLGAALFDRGLTPRGVGITLYAVARTPGVVSVPGVTVRELAPGGEVEVFESVLLGGYGFTHPVQQALAVLENEGPGVRRFLALVDDQPAAVGTLTEHDGIAYLAGAASLPMMRGLGAQTALIRTRLATAAQSCELVTVTTAFASRSQQNLEKNGFRVAHLKTAWALRDSLG